MEEEQTFTVVIMGDSVLDCGAYTGSSTDPGPTPGSLLVNNDDEAFPEFRGQDLSSLGPAELLHRAVDGSTVDALPGQARGLHPLESGVAIISVGGNDLLFGKLLSDRGSGIEEFGRKLEAFIRRLPIRPVILCTVYDPTFDGQLWKPDWVSEEQARFAHGRINVIIGQVAERTGSAVADLHAHFMEKGNEDWYTSRIEPSLIGASEVRRVLLPLVLAARQASMRKRE